MKKVLPALAVTTILFTAVGTHDADAYTRSSSRSSFRSSSSSFGHSSSHTTTHSTTRSKTTTKSKTYNLKSPSTSKIKKSTTTNPKVDITKKPTTSTTKKVTPKTSTSRKVATTHKTTVVNNHTVVYKTKYVSPPRSYSRSYYDSHYNHYHYYNNGSFTNQLITAAGVYLFLESFDNDGTPIYVNEDGKRVSGNTLNNSKPYDDHVSGWVIFFSTLGGIALLSGLGYGLYRIFRRK
jgi:hypothetical protein